jgi:Cys-tRNA(Pro) deacylase
MDSVDLARFIVENGIEAEIVTLEAETPTVEKAAEAVGVLPVQIGKSLLFFANQEPLLVIANGTTRVDYKALASILGISRKRLKLATAQQVQQVTGYPVGTVPPFGHKSILQTMVESGVLEQSEIYAGGGELNALLRIDTSELARVTDAKIVSIQGQGDRKSTSG